MAPYLALGKRPKMIDVDQDEVDSEVLQCALCHMVYNHYTRRPKLLICHHSFCLKCLQKLQTYLKVVVCVACQKETKIGPTGVTALPDNKFVLERIENVPESDDIILSSGSLMSPTKSRLVDPSPGDKPDLYCMACQGVPDQSCELNHSHEIKAYDVVVHDLEKQLAHEKKIALAKVEKELDDSNQLLMLNVYIQDAWDALKISLEQSKKGYEEKIKLTSATLEKLKDDDFGVSEARGGQLAPLERSIKEVKEVGLESTYKGRSQEETIALWRVVTNCTADVKLNEHNPSFPLNDFKVNLDLYEQSPSPECICLMFALSRYVEKRLQTKRMDSLVGSANGWGSHTLQDISNKGSMGTKPAPAPAVKTSTSTNKVENNNNAENKFQLQVAENKPKKSMAQIAAATPAPSTSRIVVTQPATRSKYPAVVYCFFDLELDGRLHGSRVIIEIYHRDAPLMARNFIELCTGVHGFGYQNTELILYGNRDYIEGGTVSIGEKVSVYDRKTFLGDSSGLADAVWMLRMKGHGSNEEGKPIVGTQFMIWNKPKEFKRYARTLVFGKVVAGFDALNALPTGRNRARIVNCGVTEYKSSRA